MNGWKKKLEDSGLVCKFLRFHRGHGSACPGCAGSQGPHEECKHHNGHTVQSNKLWEECAPWDNPHLCSMVGVYRDEANCEIIMVYTPLCGECPYFVAAD